MVNFDLSPFEGGVSKGKRWFICTFHLSREESRQAKCGLFDLSPLEGGVSKGKRWFTFTFHLSRGESRKVKVCLL